MSKDPNRAALLSRTGSYNQNSSYGSSPQSTSNIPSYGRSYGSESRQIPLSSSSSPFTNHQTSEELESQNDDAILGLSAKVRLLQEVLSLPLYLGSFLPTYLLYTFIVLFIEI
ncbi:hypothetical protein PSHT_06268 [Puccinia striiformis]|uniref:Uncharacterized protein n=1 Tax=Puccinia striiformis TaxID=27350 RepID=A0A2S4W817_9BASI|nr:hypothetical protein PSHT_06268 [Puccinia striiformis]